MNNYIELAHKLRNALKSNIFIYIPAFIVYIFSQLAISIYSPETEINISLYSIIFGEVGKITFVIYFTLYFINCIRSRSPSPLLGIIEKFRIIIKSPIDISIFFLNLFSITLIMSCFTTIKFLIPQIIPFSYDLVFHRLDIMIHMGYMPWELTHKLLSSPFATGLINIAYNLWFFIVWYVLFYFLISNHRNKAQFLLSFSMIWFLVGNLIAIISSSAGPCFVHLIDSSFDDYLPLMARLHNQNQLLTESNWWPIWALTTQDMLWAQYQTNTLTIGGGISAMPSMHVSLATLIALAFWQVSKRLGTCFIIYAAIIQIGSVHLGWHYAIDGYIGIICTLLLWKLSQILTQSTS